MTLKINDSEVFTVRVTEVHEVYQNLWLKSFIERHFKTPESQKKAWLFLRKIRNKYPKLGKRLRGELVYRYEKR